MIWLKRIFLLISGVTVIAGAIFTITKQSNLFSVRQIPIIIANDKLDAFKADSATIADLKSRLSEKLKIYEKQKIWQIKIRDMSELVGQDEWVKSVRISRVFPNALE